MSVWWRQNASLTEEFIVACAWIDPKSAESISRPSIARRVAQIYPGEKRRWLPAIDQRSLVVDWPNARVPRRDGAYRRPRQSTRDGLVKVEKDVIDGGIGSVRYEDGR